MGSVEGTTTNGGTLEKILARGYLICGITKRPGFAEFDNNIQTWSGLDVDFCRALAAGIFADTETTVVFTELENTADRFIPLAEEEVDVLAGESQTLSADIFESTTKEGFTFTKPYFYLTGLQQSSETKNITN